MSKRQIATSSDGQVHSNSFLIDSFLLIKALEVQTVLCLINYFPLIPTKACLVLLVARIRQVCLCVYVLHCQLHISIRVLYLKCL